MEINVEKLGRRLRTVSGGMSDPDLTTVQIEVFISALFLYTNESNFINL